MDTPLMVLDDVEAVDELIVAQLGDPLLRHIGKVLGLGPNPVMLGQMLGRNW